MKVRTEIKESKSVQYAKSVDNIQKSHILTSAGSTRF
jgi:hypothetical protein